METIHITLSNIALCVWNVCGGGIMSSAEAKTVNIFFFRKFI